MAAARENFFAAHEIHWNSCFVFGRIPGPRVTDVGRAGGDCFFRPQRALFSLRGIANHAGWVRERCPFEGHLVAVRRWGGEPQPLLLVVGDLFGLSPNDVEEAE